ncbi:MAG: phosphate acyltransferase [Candidatus Cloacimonadaceae bacterium]|jgi:phosphate butyryltransferase
MFKNFDEMKDFVKSKRRGRAVIAAAQTASVLDAAVLAYKEELADSILVGDKTAIIALLEEMAPDLISKFEIIDTGADPLAAVYKSVDLAREGKADLILKGKTESATIMRAVLDKDHGLRQSEVVSDVLAYEHPDGLRIMSDGGVNLCPNLKEMIAIVKNSVKTAHDMGCEMPKVALLSAIEVVNPKMESTVNAAIISKMNERGQIPGCIVEGPLAFDGAIDMEAAKLKGLTDSGVGGQADILIVPNIEAGNIYGKMVSLYCGYRVAHFVVGTKVPILIPSRADDGENKMLCMAMALTSIV